MSFLNKVAIVTGASSGIGASTAIQFAKEGANVAIVARTEEKLKEVAAEVSKVGKPALVLKADITKDEEAKKVIDETIEKFGKLDILVNNAGGTKYLRVGEENFIETYDFVMNLNLRSAVVVTNFAIPYLKQTKGNIINISSVGARATPSPGGAPYRAAKAGLNQFTRNCAMELAEFGVRANIVSPGPVKTNFLGAAGITNVSFQNIAEDSTALKILTEPEEIADVILFLASDKAKSVTGADYLIDAGYMVNGKRQ